MDHVFDLLRRRIRVVRDVGDAVTSNESIDEILYTCAA
jgi:hypothetical protein